MDDLHDLIDTAIADAAKAAAAELASRDADATDQTETARSGPFEAHVLIALIRAGGLPIGASAVVEASGLS